MLNEPLAGLVLGMGLSGEDKLHGSLPRGKLPQSRGVFEDKVSPLIRCGPPRNPDREGVFVETGVGLSIHELNQRILRALVGLPDLLAAGIRGDFGAQADLHREVSDLAGMVHRWQAEGNR